MTTEVWYTRPFSASGSITYNTLYMYVLCTYTNYICTTDEKMFSTNIPIACQWCIQDLRKTGANPIMCKACTTYKCF